MPRQSIDQLIKQFGTQEILTFSENEHGAVKALVTTPTCTAEVYMQGAHLTRWQPKDQQDVLFVSAKSAYQSGKAIRGGVPLIFPWFGANGSNPAAPAHGFVRTSQDWLLVEAGRSNDDYMLTFELTDSDVSKSFGYKEFKVTYKIAVGEELELELIVENQSHDILNFEEAFHTYLAVSDIDNVSVLGLTNTEYLDKTDGFKRKRQIEEALRFTEETDRPYLNTLAKIEIDDTGWQRKIIVDKLASNSTIVWNPWAEQTAKLSDMEPDGWRKMLCIETANMNENLVALAPGSHHTMHASIEVSKL